MYASGSLKKYLILKKKKLSQIREHTDGIGTFPNPWHMLFKLNEELVLSSTYPSRSVVQKLFAQNVVANTTLDSGGSRNYKSACIILKSV